MTAEEELILLSAGTSTRRAATLGRFEELAGRVDWELLSEQLAVRRLLPLLGPRIVASAGSRGSDRFGALVADAVELGRRRGALVQLISTRVVTTLHDAGIGATVLKGPLLGEALYGDVGRRPSSDIDLLVAVEQLYEAVRVVQTLGYGEPLDYVGDQGLPLLHFALAHERGELPPVELHWRVHWYEMEFARERLLAPAGERPGAWRPAPADELASLLLFYARDGFADLRHAVDIGAWWDAHQARLSPAALAETIGRYPALAPVLSVAACVAERVVGVPAERLTGRRATPAVRERIAVRLADSCLRSSPAQLYAEISLIDGLLAPRGGVYAFWRRQVAPPKGAMLERARRAQRTHARTTLSHSTRVLSRYALTMTRLLISLGADRRDRGDLLHS
jgi:hypothetical protein